MHLYLTLAVGFIFSLCTFVGAKPIYFNDSKTLQTQMSVESLRSNSGHIRIEMSQTLGGIELLQEQDGFQSIRVDQMVPQAETGRPETYTHGVLLGVPEGYDIKVVDERAKRREIPNTILRPVQEKYRCDCDIANNFQFDSTLYNSRDTFPRNEVEIEEIGKLQDLRLVRVAMNTVQMNFANDSLEVNEETQVVIELVPNGEEFKKAVLTPAFYAIAKQVVANTVAIADSITVASGNEKMLIVVADELKDSISELVAWKTQKGIEVEVQTVSDLGEEKESIKEAIEQRYAEVATRPTYLLFVGNGETMPPFKVTTGWQLATTDFPYSLLSGEDEVPDALYGRIVADNAEEALMQAQRMVAYEKTPSLSAQGYTEGLTIASNEGFNPSDAEYAEQVREALKKGTFTDFSVFEQGEDTANPEDIETAINEGKSWLAYFGHGDGKGWGSVNGEFNTDNIANLTNTEQLPILIDVACANASYIKTPGCFGKTWMTHQYEGKNAGLAGYYGGSVNISWHEPAIMSVGIATHHGAGKVESLGGSVLAGQLHLLGKRGPDAKNFDNLKWYNLFGDPSMLVRTKQPQAFDVLSVSSQNRVKVIAQGTGDEVNLQFALTSPTRGVLAVQTAPLNQEIEFEVENALEQGAMVTVTGYNLVTKTAMTHP